MAGRILGMGDVFSLVEKYKHDQIFLNRMEAMRDILRHIDL